MYILYYIYRGLKGRFYSQDRPVFFIVLQSVHMNVYIKGPNRPVYLHLYLLHRPVH